MSKYAILCGSAPEGKIQKKIDSMYDSLTEGSASSAYKENEIMIFPNGIDEASLCYVMNNLRMSGVETVFAYVCTVSPVADYENAVWLGGNEVRKSLFENPAALAEISGNGKLSVQVVYDSDRDFVDGGEYYYDAECVAEMRG